MKTSKKYARFFALSLFFFLLCSNIRVWKENERETFSLSNDGVIKCVWTTFRLRGGLFLVSLRLPLFVPFRERRRKRTSNRDDDFFETHTHTQEVGQKKRLKKGRRRVR